MQFTPPTADDLLRFLAAIPLTSEPMLWLDRFKTLLCELLSEVDRVSIIVNFDYDLRDGEREQITLVQEIEGGSVQTGDHLPPDLPLEAVEYFRQRGCRVGGYQPPMTLNYVVTGRERFATLYLWKYLDQPPISDQTLSLVESLCPLTAILLLNLIRAEALKKPEEKVFISTLARIVEQSGITTKQNRTLIHLLRDDSYDEIAGRTGCSKEAVKDSVKRLYRRVGVKSIRELHRKYFIPCLSHRSKS